MTDLDLSRAHIVMGPHKYAYANWWGACSCGEEFFGATADEVRQLWMPHKEAERERLGVMPSLEREQARRMRREQRQANRTTTKRK